MELIQEDNGFIMNNFKYSKKIIKLFGKFANKFVTPVWK